MNKVSYKLEWACADGKRSEKKETFLNHREALEKIDSFPSRTNYRLTTITETVIESSFHTPRKGW